MSAVSWLYSDCGPQASRSLLNKYLPITDRGGDCYYCNLLFYCHPAPPPRFARFTSISSIQALTALAASARRAEMFVITEGGNASYKISCSSLCTWAICSVSRNVEIVGRKWKTFFILIHGANMSCPPCIRHALQPFCLITASLFTASLKCASYVTRLILQDRQLKSALAGHQKETNSFRDCNRIPENAERQAL